MGEWLHTQHTRPEDLHISQRSLLAALGLNPTPRLPVPNGPATNRGWDRGVAASRQFHAREHHLDVPQRHTEDVDGAPVHLGQWISNARRCKGTMPPERIAVLTALGMRWQS
ncbi:helicase associated domain-containing protein [Streptomyces sp. NPDC059752]|uniref:helicase associated domain-containing protein n=1 Tax=unclassified Streptomyces TaxID=2593676 RepID=UPI003669BBE3